MRILAISGSLRAASSNTALLQAAALLVPPGCAMQLYEGLGALPHFNPDLFEEELGPVRELRQAVGSADGVILSSPEYGHGVPGSLKNALDWLFTGEEFYGKPVALFNASALATHAQASLKETVRVMSARLVKEACVTLPVGRGLDAEAIARDPELAAGLQAAWQAFVAAIRFPPPEED